MAASHSMVLMKLSAKFRFFTGSFRKEKGRPAQAAGAAPRA
jgi:hypothetical protein